MTKNRIEVFTGTEMILLPENPLSPPDVTLADMPGTSGK